MAQNNSLNQTVRPGGAHGLGGLRADLLAQAFGHVLEIGFGEGQNLAFYHPERIASLTACDPAPGAIGLKAPFPLNIHAAAAEKAALPAAAFDCCVITFTLCAARDPLALLQTAHRALTPNGVLLIAEHGQAKMVRTRRLQRQIEPRWRRLSGCRLRLYPPNLLAKAGFDWRDLAITHAPDQPSFLATLYSGVVSKRGAMSSRS